MGIVSAILDILNDIYKAFVVPRAADLWTQIEPHYETAKKIVVCVFVTASVVCLSLCISGFLFGTIYFYNMPTIYHTFPLNFKYNRGCMQQHKMLEKFGGGVHEIYKKPCFPVATFPLAYADNYKLLQIGQAYSIVTKLEIPETPRNMEIGSFMVLIDIKGVNETKGKTDIHKEKTLQKKKRGKNRKEEPSEGKKIHQFVATKSVSFSYKSPLIRLMNFAIFWPLFLFDFYQETQTFDIVLFDKLKLNPAGLNWTAHVYIDHPSIMVNVAQLDVTAQFSGIQALLYRWPVVSFFVGTAALFPAVLFTVLLALYFLMWQVFFTEEQMVVSRRSRRPANLVAGPQQLASRNDDDDVIDQPADVTTQCDDSVHDDPAQDDVFNGSFVMGDVTSSRRSSSSSCSIEMIGHSGHLSTRGSEASFVVATTRSIDSGEISNEEDLNLTEEASSLGTSVNNPSGESSIRRRQVP